MKLLSITFMVLLIGGCAEMEDEVTPPTLEDACASRVCPADPPETIDCQPVVSEGDQPLCAESCREFLQDTCHISFVD